MKKLIAMVLCVLLLSACSPNSPSSLSAKSASAPIPPSGSAADSGESDATDPYANISGDLLVEFGIEDWGNKMIAAFMEKYPNVNVKFQLGDGGNFALDAPAGIGADVVRFNNLTKCLEGELLEPFPAELQTKYEKILFDNAYKSALKGDKLYGAPYEFGTIALYYNKDIFPTPPKSFEEIIEFSKTYNDPTKDKYAMRWMVGSGIDFPFLTAFGWQLFGPNGDDYKQIGFDLPSVTKGLEFYKSMHEVFPLKSADINFENSIMAFVRGETPLTLSYGWLSKACVEAGLNFGVAKIPTINGVDPLTPASTNYLCVSSYSKNKDAAFAFVDFMLSNEGTELTYDTIRIGSARNDVSEMPAIAADEYLAGEALQFPYTYPAPSIVEIESTFFWTSLQELITYVWDGTLSIEQAQAKAMETYELGLNTLGKSLKD